MTARQAGSEPHRASAQIRGGRLVRVIARGGLLGRGLFYLTVGSAGNQRGERAFPPRRAGQRQRRPRPGSPHLDRADPAGRCRPGVCCVRRDPAGRRIWGPEARPAAPAQHCRPSRAVPADGGRHRASLLGRHSTGSEQQQRSATADVLGLPAGRVLVAVIGLVVLAVCGWQLRVGVRGYSADSLNTDRMPAPIRRATHLPIWPAPVGGGC